MTTDHRLIIHQNRDGTFTITETDRELKLPGLPLRQLTVPDASSVIDSLTSYLCRNASTNTNTTPTPAQ